MSDNDENGKVVADFLREMCRAVQKAKLTKLKVLNLKKNELKEFEGITTENCLLNVAWYEVEFILSVNDTTDYLEFKTEISDESGVKVIFPGATVTGHIISNGKCEKISLEDFTKYKVTSDRFEVCVLVYQ